AVGLREVGLLWVVVPATKACGVGLASCFGKGGAGRGELARAARLPKKICILYGWGRRK
nr:hypothetical protein [Tanacetum cinerariifolium]